jgi:hypothetical protein
MGWVSVSPSGLNAGIQEHGGANWTLRIVLGGEWEDPWLVSRQQLAVLGEPLYFKTHDGTSNHHPSLQETTMAHVGGPNRFFESLLTFSFTA